MKRRLRIAILGTRGIPARYGGFETLAEELSARLAARGHSVTVYCRAHYWTGLKEYRGVELRVLPTFRRKHLDTVVHGLISALDVLYRRRFDVALVCNAANVICVPLLRLGGARVALNVDGIERRRRKWGWPGRAYYSLCERLATILPDVFISDAEVIRSYYRERYNKDSPYIPYGAEAIPANGRATLERCGLEPQRYVLYVARLEPENNAHLVIEAFGKVAGDWQLAVVGDAPYAGRYIEKLRRAAGPRVIFTGAIYGEGYRELLSHCACYIQATEVGGTHPALLEAMAHGNIVIANRTPENIEVLADAGLYYRPGSAEDLAKKIQMVLEDRERFAELGRRAAERVAVHYSWDQVVEKYQQLFYRLFEAGQK